MRETVQAPTSEEDSSTWQRVAATAAGGTLLALGLRRRTIPGYAAAAAGGWMMYRGIRGQEGREIDLESLQSLEARAEAIEVDRTLTIQASPEEVRTFLEDPANLDHVLGEAGSVEAPSPDLQRWTLETPIGYALTWEMQRQESEDENELAWTSTDGGDLEMSMQMRPAPGDRGTELTLQMGFRAPGGGLGAAVLERLEIVPYTLAGRWLRRIKSLLETGELPTLEGELARHARQP